MLARTRGLLRGAPAVHDGWILSRTIAGFAEPALFIVLGGAAYGAAMGAWRDPRLALYVAVKLPVLLLATALVDATINALWARRLGLDLTFAQSLRAVLLAFGLTAILLGSFAPIILFLDLALPGPDATDARVGHDVLGLTHVALIAVAGVLVVLRQRRWLVSASAQPGVGGRVVAIWLVVNLLVGAQLSWNLRPWFGTPGMSVELLRPDAFDGSFWESIYKMVVDHTR